MTCGSVWGCPECTPRILAGRSDEITGAARRWTAAGGSLVMVSLTARHGAPRPLAPFRLGLMGAWAGLRRSKAWQRLDAAGYVRVVEVTHGWEHGFHPHLHVLVFLRGAGVPSDEVVGQLRRVWERQVVRALGPEYRPSDERGLDLRGSDSMASGYVAKVGLEIAGGTNKTRHPFLLLDEKSSRATAAWLEYAAATFGARCLEWSQGMRTLLGVGLQEDEDLAAGELPGDEVEAAVWLFDRGVWRDVVMRTVDGSGVPLWFEVMEAMRGHPGRGHPPPGWVAEWLCGWQ